MKRGLKKKGLSPVVSTVLLIALVIIIAIIILLWYRSFIKERVLKFDESIDSICKKVVLEPFVNEDGTFGFKNNGNIPVFGVNLITKTTDGEINVEKLSDGDYRVSIGTAIELPGYTYSDYKEVKITPILIGKVKTGESKEYECPEKIISFTV